MPAKTVKITIEGPPESGKTAIAAEVIKALNNHGVEVVATGIGNVPSSTLDRIPGNVVQIVETAEKVSAIAKVIGAIVRLFKK